jgi:hypothetical protein
VQTASKLQVRRPIYATSIARWKRYEKHLLPLEQALAADEQAGERAEPISPAPAPGAAAASRSPPGT